MEKQKVFWVVLSVSVFVVVVLVAGVFLLKQRPTALADGLSAVHPLSDPGTSVYEFGRDVTSSSGDTEVLRFVIGGDQGTGAQAPIAVSPTTQPLATATAPTAEKPAPAAEKPAAAKPAAARPAAAKPATAARGPVYWIQTGSYRSQTKAEDLAQALGAKGLAGRVFTFEQARETFFRVRIGPYGNRAEAEKFLVIVRQIQGLEASYISLVPGNRSVN